MLEKRVYASPVEFAPLSMETGKMQGVCYVNILRSVYENGVMLAKSPNHRTAVVIQPNGSWAYAVEEPDADIAKALADALPTVLTQIEGVVAGYGIMDHEVVKDGNVVAVSYAKDGNLFVRKEMPGDA